MNTVTVGIYGSEYLYYFQTFSNVTKNAWIIIVRSSLCCDIYSIQIFNVLFVLKTKMFYNALMCTAAVILEISARIPPQNTNNCDSIRFLRRPKRLEADTSREEIEIQQLSFLALFSQHHLDELPPAG